MQHQYSMRSPAVKRLMKEAQELKDPTELFYAQPLDDNLFEWHFTIRGPGDTEFDGGIYHGRIALPPDYPMKPPSIIILTPNGRFEVNKKICLSISGHHPESWQPSWSIRTTLLAIIGFMPTHGAGAIGSLDYTPDERKILSKKSLCWKCPNCGNVSEILKPLTDASKETSQEAKALASQINFAAEKGDKSNQGKANSSNSKAPASSSQNTNTSQTATNSSSQGATAAATTPTSAASMPQMMFPSAMNPGGMPGMFPQMPPFLPPMAGQFPFPYRFPYPPPMNTDPNSLPCNLMMPPFPNPFMPPMFPAGFTLPPAGSNPENQTSTNTMPPSFPFPFMPAPPPTVPVSPNPASTVNSNPVTTISTQAINSVNKSPSTSSATKTSTSPSTSTTSSATPSTSSSKDQTQNGSSAASIIDASTPSSDPSTASSADTSTPLSTSSPSSSLDAPNAANTNSEENKALSETDSPVAAETSTPTESGLRQRTGTSGATTANSDQPTAATQATAPPITERVGQSRSTPSFVLMVILGAAILLLCLRRLYISTDNFPYPDYQH